MTRLLTAGDRFVKACGRQRARAAAVPIIGERDYLDLDHEIGTAEAAVSPITRSC